MREYVNIFKNLLSLDSKKRGLIVEMFASCALYNLSELLPPIAIAGIIASVTSYNYGNLWLYAVLLAFFYILYYTMLFWNKNAYMRLGSYYQTEFQTHVLEHVTENDEILKDISKGKIVMTIADDISYLNDVADCASGALVGLIELVIVFCIFARYNIFVAVVVLSLDFIYYVHMRENSRSIARHYEGMRKYEDKTVEIINQTLLNLKQVKSLNMTESLSRKFLQVKSKWNDDYIARRKNLTSRYTKIPYVVYMGKVLLYVFLAYMVIKEKMTIDILILLVSYFDTTIAATNEMLEYLLNYVSDYGIRVNRIKNILEFKNGSSAMTFGDFDNDYINGSVVFDNVTYSIKKNKILNDVSFKIYPNEITAIVGKVGSGKTTIFNLLYRLDRIKSGSITIDNESIYNYSNKVYSSNVSGVFQNPFIFEMSIRENLSLVDSDKNKQIEVCKRVGLHERILALPKGYNTVLSSESPLLSSGEIQLLTIARALLSKAEILLFDEVTSNADKDSTAHIREVILDLKTDHTVVVITHKPSIMDIADRVIVMSNGRIVDKGMNEDVFNRCELYRELKNNINTVSKQDNINEL